MPVKSTPSYGRPTATNTVARVLRRLVGKTETSADYAHVLLVGYQPLHSLPLHSLLHLVEPLVGLLQQPLSRLVHLCFLTVVRNGVLQTPTHIVNEVFRGAVLATLEVLRNRDEIAPLFLAADPFKVVGQRQSPILLQPRVDFAVEDVRGLIFLQVLQNGGEPLDELGLLEDTVEPGAERLAMGNKFILRE